MEEVGGLLLFMQLFLTDLSLRYEPLLILQRKNLMNFTSNVIGMEYDLWPFKPENYQKYHFGFVHWIFNWIQTIIFHLIN